MAITALASRLFLWLLAMESSFHNHSAQITFVGPLAPALAYIDACGVKGSCDPGFRTGPQPRRHNPTKPAQQSRRPTGWATTLLFIASLVFQHVQSSRKAPEDATSVTPKVPASDLGAFAESIGPIQLPQP